MRLLITVLLILLLLATLGFVTTNLDARVDLTVGGKTYDQVALYLIVIAALLVGVAFAGIVAVAEGVNTRLDNRRLSREIRKLETEINYLRTQSPATARKEPEDLPADRSLPAGTARNTGGADAPASAPIYDPGSGEWDPDDDDDIYTGGRAV
jgi:hypothetical protein